MLQGQLITSTIKSNTKPVGRLGATCFFKAKARASLSPIAWGLHFSAVDFPSFYLSTPTTLHPQALMLTYQSPANDLCRDDVRPACSSKFVANPVAEMPLQSTMLAGRRDAPRISLLGAGGVSDFTHLNAFSPRQPQKPVPHHPPCCSFYG